MSYTAKTAEEYSAKITQKLNDNDGKIFLVDYSKSCAVKTLTEVLSSKDSHFILVENRRIAKDILTLLEPVLGTFTLIDSKAALAECLKSVRLDFKSTQNEFVSGAQVFKSHFPRVIFTFQDEESGGDLLHAVLCKDGTRNGVYEGETNRSEFCVSDILAVSGYESVVIDSVYKYFAFEKENIYADQQFVCGEYERMDFLGEAHYIHRSYSYRRLRNIVNASKKCVLISDVIANGEAVELYAALNMLCEKFSLQIAKERVSKMTSYYDADCDELLSNLSFVETEQPILSAWLRSLKEVKQTVPGDMESLSLYVRENFRYMSEEERFLRAVTAAIEANFKGQAPSMGKLLDGLDSNTQAMVNTLKQMFFNDELKGELESVLGHGRINQMSSEEIGGMYSVFQKYGVCHFYTSSADATKVLRLKRDDCGFEYFVAREGECRTLRADDEYTYSIIHCGSTTLYKAIALQKMLDGREPRCKAESPLLIVTRKDVDEVVRAVEKVLIGYTCTTDIHDFTEKTKNTAAVVTYEALIETPFWLQIGTAVFFDVLPDGIGMKNAVEKALRYGSANAYILVDYANLSGHFMDEWQDLLFSGKRMLPISGAQVNLKESRESEYGEILQELDTMYRLLNHVTICGGKSCVESCIDQYNRLITDYTLRVRPRPGILQRDFAYLASLTKEYQTIFQNCMTIGGEGEKIVSETYSYVKITKEDEKTKEKVEEIVERADKTEKRYIFFNACASMLFRHCDWRTKNCNGCDGYEKFGVNDFECFAQNLFELLGQTKKFIQEAEKYQWIKGSGELIQGGSSEEKKNRLVLEEIEALEQEANDVISNVRRSKDGKKLFWIDYETADELRGIALRTYCKLLQKYYSTVMEIFNKATEKAKASFDTVNSDVVFATSEV